MIQTVLVKNAIAASEMVEMAVELTFSDDSCLNLGNTQIQVYDRYTTVLCRIRGRSMTDKL